MFRFVPQRIVSSVDEGPPLPDEARNWHIIYPCYLDSSKSYQQGF
jgi:hypothetical protein